MKKTTFLVRSAAVAAMYVALTYLSFAFGLANQAVQLRLSEALCLLPCFMPEAVPGLFVGCLLSNLLTGCALWDIVFGSLATLLAAILTRALKNHRFLGCLPPIVVNALVIPPILYFVYGAEGTYLYFTFTVFMGQLLSCGILGQAVYSAFSKIKKYI